ncbi:MAG: DUF4129 domain-containing protein [Gammaproteobacteria bacterium]|nr:DUF4129 domain-containing protein [Gammaproteobacteria bacterium]
MRAGGRGWIGGLLLAAACQVFAQNLDQSVADSFAGAPFGAETSARLRACLASLDASGEESIDLASRCPHAARHVASASHAGLVEGLSGETVGREALRDLIALSESFAAPAHASAAAGLDFAGLDALLDEVLIEEDTDVGWWERFLQWLKSKLPEDSGADYDWIVDWLEDLDVPEWLTDLIYHGSVVALIVLALFVVANEVRASGILRRRWRRGRATRAATQEAAAQVAPRGLDELAGLAPRARAAAVLALVVRHLAERGWIAERASLTTGELEREVARTRRALASPFHQLVAVVESVVYGDRDPDPATERALLVNARALLEDGP